MQRKCTIKLLDQVNCVFTGIHPDHIAYFFEEYSVFAPNHFFNPKFKLGSWDGRISYFHKTGKTYVNLLADILPRLASLGYKINFLDARCPIPLVTPEFIGSDYFDHIIDEESGRPWFMRIYQVDMVNALIKNGGGVGLAGTGAGKALSVNAKVLTPSGWRLNGDLLPGDEVITPDGKLSSIVDVFPQGKKQLYEIVFHDGSKVKCCKEHLWQVKFPKQLHKAWTEDRVVSTQDIINFLNRKQSGVHTPGNVSIPLVSPIEYDVQDHKLDPYSLGVLIGDGCLRTESTMISSADVEILERLAAGIDNFDVKLIHRTNYDYGIVKQENQNTCPPSPNAITEELKALHLAGCVSNTKFIPPSYKKGSVEQRFELIRGLFDTDGTADKRGNMSFTTVSEQLATDVQEMVWSLGGTCTITTRIPTYTYKSQKCTGQLAYTCFVNHPTPKNFFHLTRKKDRVSDKYTNGRIELTRRVKEVNLLGLEEAQCISIDDPSQLYITDDYIVTHNTSMCAALAKSYEDAGNYRSLIIVPDKNLTEQTYAEYALFGIDVGQYSGDKKDIAHQHVVSTWQSLQNNPKLVQDFDVIIVDEAHGLKGQVLTKLLLEYAKDVPFRFGVTGTLPKAETDAMAVRIAVGDVQYTIPAHVLQAEGYLAKLHIDILQLSDNLKPQFEEWKEEYLEDWKKDNPGQTMTYLKFKDSYFPDYAGEKRFLQTKAERLQWIADYISIKREEKQGNVFCLVNGIAFGKRLSKLVEGSIFLHGSDKMVVRKEAYDLFKDNDNVVVFATVNIASTGLNIKRIFNLMFIDMGKSFIRTIQTIGRGLRKAPDKDSVHVTDICSDLKYSKKHVRERIKYYKEAHYKHKKHLVDYDEE